MNDAPRLAAVISSLQAGGAERVLTRLLNHWSKAGWAVTVFTFEPVGAHPFYPLDLRVNYCPLGLAGTSRHVGEAIHGNFRRVAGLRRALRQSCPQAVLSFCAETNVTTLAAAYGLNLPTIVSERADPACHRIGRFWREGRRWLYPGAKFIVLQTGEAAEFFPSAWRPRLRVIPNPVVPAPPARGAIREKRLLAVGRLEAQKGFDSLLAAFARARAHSPGWTLRVIGEGRARNALVAQAMELGLGDAVEFPGLSRDIEREYAEAGIFVLSSRYEGFPNVLCEAMAAGAPTVAFACRGGVKEIVRDGVDGLLAPPGDIAALAFHLERLMGDAELRRQLGNRAPDVVQRFSAELSLKDWTQCLQAALLP